MILSLDFTLEPPVAAWKHARTRGPTPNPINLNTESGALGSPFLFLLGFVTVTAVFKSTPRDPNMQTGIRSMTLDGVSIPVVLSFIFLIRILQGN